MRGYTYRLTAVLAYLSALGKDAAQFAELDALRVGSRLGRAMRRRVSNHMPLAEVIRKSAARRRARQTHPGKR